MDKNCGVFTDGQYLSVCCFFLLRLYIYSRLWEKHDEVTKRVEQSDKSKEFTMAHCIGQIDPPELDSLHVRFLITHVDNPNSFWVNYCGERFDVQAHGLQDAIGKSNF